MALQGSWTSTRSRGPEPALQGTGEAAKQELPPGRKLGLRPAPTLPEGTLPCPALSLLRHGLRPWPVGLVGWSIIRSQGFRLIACQGTYPECVCRFHLQPVVGEGNPSMSLSPPPFLSLSASMGECPEMRVNSSKGSHWHRRPGWSLRPPGGLCPPLQGPPGSHVPPEQAPWPHWLLPALLPQLLPTLAPCSQSQPPCSMPRLLFPSPSTLVLGL